MSAREWFDPDKLYDHSVPAGRLQYLWGGLLYPATAISLVAILVLSLTVAIEMALRTDTATPFTDSFGLVVILLALLLYISCSLLMTLRRLRDLRISENFAFLMFVPLISNVFSLCLLLAPGKVQGSGLCRLAGEDHED